MSRLESGVRFNYELTDMGQLVRQCVLQMEPRLRQHEVQLELPSQLMAEVSASWISRAVTLLLDNAARYTPAGTRILVAVSGDGFSCRIAMRDHGPGIPAKLKTGLFLKSTRVDRKDAKMASTGLGLPICKIVAEGHGGSIRVDAPRDGGGTVFTLTLPVSQKNVKAKKRPA
jgi:two-component system sensor histidine kinase KdpD